MPTAWKTFPITVRAPGGGGGEAAVLLREAVRFRRLVEGGAGGMKKPSTGKNRVTHTICCTGEDWELVRQGASCAGMSASAWWTECALTVDLSPKGGKARPLVLDAGRQRGLSEGVSALARGLDAADEEMLSQYRDDIRAILEEPLRAMVEQDRREKAMELLRTVFGEERAAVIAAAFVPDPEEAPGSWPSADPEAGSPEVQPDRKRPRSRRPCPPAIGKDRQTPA